MFSVTVSAYSGCLKHLDSRRFRWQERPWPPPAITAGPLCLQPAQDQAPSQGCNWLAVDNVISASNYVLSTVIRAVKIP